MSNLKEKIEIWQRIAEKIRKDSKITPKTPLTQLNLSQGDCTKCKKIKVQTSSWRIDLQNLVSDCSDFPSKLNNTCLELNHDFCWKNRLWTHVYLKREEISKIANKDFKRRVQGCYGPNLKTMGAVVMELNTKKHDLTACYHIWWMVAILDLVTNFSDAF